MLLSAPHGVESGWMASFYPGWDIFDKIHLFAASDTANYDHVTVNYTELIPIPL